MCPNGLVSDGNGDCIKEELCPCAHNGATYQAGETLKVDCNTWYACFVSYISWGRKHKEHRLTNNEKPDIMCVLFTVLARTDNGSVPHISVMEFVQSTERVTISPLMRKGSTLMETVNTLSFRFVSLYLVELYQHWKVWILTILIIFFILTGLLWQY